MLQIMLLKKMIKFSYIIRNKPNLSFMHFKYLFIILIQFTWLLLYILFMFCIKFAFQNIQYYLGFLKTCL